MDVLKLRMALSFGQYHQSENLLARGLTFVWVKKVASHFQPAWAGNQLELATEMPPSNAKPPS